MLEILSIHVINTTYCLQSIVMHGIQQTTFQNHQKEWQRNEKKRNSHKENERKKNCKGSKSDMRTVW